MTSCVELFPPLRNNSQTSRLEVHRRAGLEQRKKQIEETRRINSLRPEERRVALQEQHRLRAPDSKKQAETWLERCKSGEDTMAQSDYMERMDPHMDRRPTHFDLDGTDGTPNPVGMRMHGERNSGTSYLAALCAENTCGKCDDKSKHSMAKIKLERPMRHERFHPRDRSHNTLDVVLIRNAVDWLLSMWRYPIHCSYHCDLPTFYEFISTEWGKPPDGSKSWAGLGKRPNCAGTAYYVPPPKGKGPSKNILDHRTRWIQSFRALEQSRSDPSTVVFITHEKLKANGGLGFSSMFQDLADKGLLVLRPSFPNPILKKTGRSNYVKSGMHSAYDQLGAGTWPTFTPQQFQRRGTMTKARPLNPTIDVLVLRHIRDNVNASIEGLLGYDYRFELLLG